MLDARAGSPDGGDCATTLKVVASLGASGIPFGGGRGNNRKRVAGRSQVLVVEDVHEATCVLQDNGHSVTRITYAELMSLGGDAILSRLSAGEFYMFWCQTPVDWFVRPGDKRPNSL